MKKNIYILLFILSQNIYSQKETIFWKIQKDSTVSYLLGTQHMFGYSFLNDNSLILDKIKESKIILTENINSFDSIVSARIENKAIDFLNTDQISMISKMFKYNKNISKLSLKECLLQADKYWGRISCLNEDEINDTLTIDNSIKEFAIKNKIKVKGLENLSETINYINQYTYTNIDDEKLKDILIYKLNCLIQNTKHDHCDIEKLYRKKSYIYSFEKKIDAPVITDRNNKWMKNIPTILEKYKNVFIAVGIAHLDFDLGLINQLRQKGYIITPIRL
jgi:hypothetical protein